MKEYGMRTNEYKKNKIERLVGIITSKILIIIIFWNRNQENYTCSQYQLSYLKMAESLCNAC